MDELKGYLISKPGLLKLRPVPKLVAVAFAASGVLQFECSQGPAGRTRVLEFMAATATTSQQEREANSNARQLYGASLWHELQDALRSILREGGCW